MIIQHEKGDPMGMTPEKIGRKAIRVANAAVNFSVLLFLLLLVAFSGYALWDSKQLYGAADAARYERYKPVEGEDTKSFAELQAINPEVFGWLTVYGTHIDYPITQGPDNMKYVNTNAQGEYSLSGSIFLDSDNQRDFSDFNSILYGHHMEKQAMFGELGLFADKQYFDAREYGSLYYDGKDHGIVFFAFLHVDAYDKSVFTAAMKGQEAQQQYLDNLLSQAAFTRDATVTIDDHIVLLSTCSMESTNGRDILVGKITDTVYDDIFRTDETDSTDTQETVPRWKRILSQIPVWAWVLVIAILILLVSAVLRRYRKHSRLADKEDSTDSGKE